MTVIARKGRNRIPLTGLLHIFLFPLLVFAAAAVAPQSAHAAFNEEVPFITTPGNVTEAMMEIAAVKAGDHVIDLGSGDGRIVIAAAKRGASGLGVDNDPKLVAESIENAKRAGVSSRARFLEQDLFRTELARASVVTMYLLPEVNLQLRPAILALRPGTRIVSHDWDMGDWRPDRSVTLAVPDKVIGIEKSSRVHLWIVPARVEGLWCGAKGHRRARLRLRQSYQFVDGEFEAGGEAIATVSGRIDGKSITLARGDAQAILRFEWTEGTLRTREAGGFFARARDLDWRRAPPGRACMPG